MSTTAENASETTTHFLGSVTCLVTEVAALQKYCQGTGGSFNLPHFLAPTGFRCYGFVFLDGYYPRNHVAIVLKLTIGPNDHTISWPLDEHDGELRLSRYEAIKEFQW